MEMNVKTPTEKAPPEESSSRPHNLRSNEQQTLLALLPEPVPYTVRVSSLSLEAPLPSIPLPLPIPVQISHHLAQRFLGDKYASVHQESTMLLHNVNLECRPGELLAIIGSSGSGKSTLLNALAHRTGRLKVVSGNVQLLAGSPDAQPGSASHDHSTPVDGTVRPPSSLRSLGDAIGFVRQDDFLLPGLTVRETLQFSAYLRLPASVDHATREAVVEKTILELGLLDAADTVVGGPFRKGISGGERRRLSIGCVLVTLPSVLVLDEPTTGLDATAAYHLLSLLSSLSHRGRTIIISIHQPRSDAYMLFDRICLLSGGSVVYSGSRAEALPWFEHLGFVPDVRTNPLDFLIDISAIDTRDEESETRTRGIVEDLIRRWTERENKSTVEERRSSASIPSGRGSPEQMRDSLKTASERKRPGLIPQSIVLARRSFLNVYRDYGLLLGFLSQAVIIGVMLGLTFYKPPETPAGVQTLKTVYYQGQVAFVYLTFILYIFINCSQFVVFDREREDRLYSVIPYVASHYAAYLPINIIAPSVYAIIIYFMCGFRIEDLARNLFIFIGICILQQLCSFAYALLAASIARSFAEASLFANGFSIVFIMSAGYLIVDLPTYIGWTKWLSPYFYGFRWLAISQFKGRQFACEGLSGAERSQCSGDNVLTGLRFNLNTPIWVYPVGLIAFIFVVTGLAIALLQYYHPGGVRHAAKQIGKQKESNRSEKATVMNNRPDRDSVHVELRDLTLTVKKRGRSRGKSDKQILSGINAQFEPGKVSCIMGPSGAGKSSLLEVLSGQLATGLGSRFEVTGDILFNGHALSEATKSLVAFVQQSDSYLLPALTIRETLHYAADLQLRGMTRKQKIQRAEEVLRTMGLRPVADHMVGGEVVKGISGGEKRRLSLAVQLISDPSVLMCDEPTSGLDAFTALSIMDTLRQIAASGRTVIATIHQPRSEIWATAFDDVILLSSGKTVYAGPKDMLLPTLEAAGQVAPLHYNPADFALDVISIDRRDEVIRKETTERVEGLIQFWDSGHRLKLLEGHLRDDIKHGELPKLEKMKTRSLVKALPIVLSRSWKNLRRQQDVFVARLANPPFLVLLFWLYFLRLSHGPSGAQDRVGLLIENSAMPFVGMLASIAIYPAERDAFYREYKNPASRYSAATFILSYTIQEVPMQIISSMLYSIIMVGGMGLQLNARIYFEYVSGIFGLLNFGESVGIIFASWVRNGGLSVSLVSSALTVLSQTCGIISITLPGWLKVIAWGSALTYQARVAFINEMQGLTFDCNQAQISSGECLAVSGEQLLDQFGFRDRNTAKFTGLLLVLLVIYRLLAYLAVRARIALL